MLRRIAFNRVCFKRASFPASFCERIRHIRNKYYSPMISFSIIVKRFVTYLVDIFMIAIGMDFSFSYIHIYVFIGNCFSKTLALKQIFRIYVFRKGSEIREMNEMYDWRASTNLVWRGDIQADYFIFKVLGKPCHDASRARWFPVEKFLTIYGISFGSSSIRMIENSRIESSIWNKYRVYEYKYSVNFRTTFKQSRYKRIRYKYRDVYFHNANSILSYVLKIRSDEIQFLLISISHILMYHKFDLWIRFVIGDWLKIEKR